MRGNNDDMVMVTCGMVMAIAITRFELRRKCHCGFPLLTDYGPPSHRYGSFRAHVAARHVECQFTCKKCLGMLTIRCCSQSNWLHHKVSIWSPSRRWFGIPTFKLNAITYEFVNLHQYHQRLASGFRTHRQTR